MHRNRQKTAAKKALNSFWEEAETNANGVKAVVETTVRLTQDRFSISLRQKFICLGCDDQKELTKSLPKAS